jgi:hypothetical protein
MTEQPSSAPLVSLAGIALVGSIFLIALKSTVAPGMSWWVAWSPVLLIFGPVAIAVVLLGLYGLGALITIPILARHEEKKRLRIHDKLHRGIKP